MNSKYHRRPSFHHHRKLSNGPSLPRKLLHPTRIAALAIVILIVLFINFQSGAETPAVRRAEDGMSREPERNNVVQKPLGKTGRKKEVLGGENDPDGRKPGARIAIVTFTTDQKSYTHLSLKNHDRTFHPLSLPPSIDSTYFKPLPFPPFQLPRNSQQTGPIHPTVRPKEPQANGNTLDYVRKHNYTLLVDYQQNNKRGAMWHKFVMIETAIRSGLYDWVWWMDFDTLITNTSIRVEDVIAQELANVTHTEPEDIDFLFTPDW
jgi:galactosyl transferase GMA12/MNN10 family